MYKLPTFPETVRARLREGQEKIITEAIKGPPVYPYETPATLKQEREIINQLGFLL